MRYSRAAPASTGPSSLRWWETCKLNAVDPQAYLTDIIARVVVGHLQSQIDELLPWANAPALLKAVA